MTRRFRVAVPFSVVALAVLAVLVSPAGAQKRGGVYRAVLAADPPTLDPAQANRHDVLGNHPAALRRLGRA